VVWLSSTTRRFHSSGGAEYPSDENFQAALREVTERFYLVPGIETAKDVGDARVNNIVMLGALSAFLDVDPEVWKKVIRERVPPKYVEMNLKAFDRGRMLTGD
jgi:indolepyruvate ferredoxin oxidoreductase beta subunit